MKSLRKIPSLIPLIILNSDKLVSGILNSKRITEKHLNINMVGQKEIKREID